MAQLCTVCKMAIIGVTCVQNDFLYNDKFDIFFGFDNPLLYCSARKFQGLSVEIRLTVSLPSAANKDFFFIFRYQLR